LSFGVDPLDAPGGIACDRIEQHVERPGDAVLQDQRGEQVDPLRQSAELLVRVAHL
jgi:hypothetical protein